MEILRERYNCMDNRGLFVEKVAQSLYPRLGYSEVVYLRVTHSLNRGKYVYIYGERECSQLNKRLTPGLTCTSTRVYVYSSLTLTRSTILLTLTHTLFHCLVSMSFNSSLKLSSIVISTIPPDYHLP